MIAPGPVTGAQAGWADWFGWQGRLGRRRFILRTLGVALVVGAAWLGALLLMLMVYGYAHHATNQPLDIVVAVVAYGVLAAGVWIVLAGEARRFHDLGRSGLWVLLNLLPVAGWIAVLGVAVLWPGQPQANRFGDPPP